jgi:hypothetical protein
MQVSVSKMQVGMNLWLKNNRYLGGKILHKNCIIITVQGRRNVFKHGEDRTILSSPFLLLSLLSFIGGEKFIVL